VYCTYPADLAAAGAGLHAAVLGLRAAAGTAPYTVPPWLPGVLSGLAAAASAPPPTGKVGEQGYTSVPRSSPTALSHGRLPWLHAKCQWPSITRCGW
jgi:Domain of unknown function (DUF3437)